MKLNDPILAASGGVDATVDREEEQRQREYRALMRKFWVSAAV